MSQSELQSFNLKKLFSILLALALVFGLLPVSVLADNAENLETEAGIVEVSQRMRIELPADTKITLPVFQTTDLPAIPEPAEAPAAICLKEVLIEAPTGEPDEEFLRAAAPVGTRSAQGAPIVPEWVGSGTETSPFEISSLADLMELAEAVNSGYTYTGYSFLLTANITITDTSFTPIGLSPDIPFGGTFRGNGKTVSLTLDGTTPYKALFGAVTGTVENLNVEANITGGDYVGGVAACNYGTITNCTVSGSVSGASYVGGVAGMSGQGATVSNCSCSAVVNGEGTAIGGVVGAANNISEHGGHADAQGGENGKDGPQSRDGAAIGTVSDCSFSGTLTGVSVNDPDDPIYDEANGTITIRFFENAYGGVVGWSNGYRVVDCVNSGTVTGDDFAGGVVGDSTNGGVIMNCRNTGSVTGSGWLTGGITGRMNQGTISHCYNSGSVTGLDFTGGIVGFSDKESTVYWCENEGSTSVTGAQFVGGVIGISNCAASDLENFGAVYGRKYTGGAVGYTTKDLENCTAASGAQVSDRGHESVYGFTGGVVGYSAANVANCHNQSAVNARLCAGGVAGHASGGVSGCTNTGSVTGTDYVGGVVGQASGTVTACSNSGAVSGTSYTGGVAGEAGGLVRISFNTANVTGTLAFTGGVAGRAKAGLNSCTNSGTVMSASVSTGGVAGSIEGHAENCENTGAVTGEGGLTGGVAGVLAIGGTMDNCRSSGRVTGGAYTGGVIGQASGSASNSTNSGQVTGTASGVGGFAGRCSAALENCTNSGAVSGGMYTGGIAGICTKTGVLRSCTNQTSGVVTSAESCVGGVAGISGEASENHENDGGSLEDCINHAEIHGGSGTGGAVGWGTGSVSGCTNSGSVYGGNITGGVAGYSCGEISGCSNEAAVQGSASTGGIAGLKEGSITGSCNTAQVSGGENTGGIIGENRSGSVDGCINRGSVTANAMIVGGVAGKNIGSLASCRNEAPVNGEKYTGGIAGYNQGTVDQCTNAESGTVNGSTAVGGIAGQNKGTLSNCLSCGAVTGGVDTGGTAGENLSAITGCRNEATVSGGGRNKGGIAGYTDGLISDCTNTGAVSQSSGDNTGGIAGINWDTISDCLNQGSITAPAGLNTGGIVGELFSTINNCTNAGEISVDPDRRQVGGIAGSGTDCTISNCKNSAVVTGGRSSVGGILGATSTANVMNCENTASVRSSAPQVRQVGGIVGLFTGGAGYEGSIYRCINTGSIQIGNSNGFSHAGGIVGNTDTDAGTVSQCVNRGSVTATGAEVGGIIGKFCGGCTLSNSYNTGTIRGSNRVGGVIGMILDGSACERCYNYTSTQPSAADSGGSWGKLFGNKEAGAQLTLTHNVFTDNSLNPAGWDTLNFQSGYHYFTNSGMTNQSNFTDYGWNFSNVWRMGSNAPVLRFESGFDPGDEPSGGEDPGSPTAENLYIYTVEEFRAFRDAVNGGNEYAGASVFLCADIDLGAEEWTPIGLSGGSGFRGVFEGQGHSITGLNVVKTDGNMYYGLFGSISEGAVVRDLAVYGTVTTDGWAYAGGIAGVNNGIIERCAFTGDITGTFSPGGIMATGSGSGQVINCRHSGAVNGSGWYAGGVVGIGNVINSVHVSGLVSGEGAEGGVIGDVYSFAINAYCLEGAADQPVGTSYDGANIDNVSALTAQQMLNEASFHDWDFVNTWGMGTDGPVLRVLSNCVTLDGNFDSAGQKEVWIPKLGGPLPGCPFERGGFIFTGWNTSPDGSGTAYADGASVRGSMTLYAQWTPGGIRYDGYVADNQYSALFDNNDSTGSSVGGIIEFYTKHYVKPAGYALFGTADESVSWVLEAKAFGADQWTILAQGSEGALAADGRSVFKLSSGGEYCYYRLSFTGAMQLNEFYLIVSDPNTDVRLPVITFHSHEGSGNMTPQTGENRSTVTLKNNSFTRAGYAFAGWNTAPDGSGTAYGNGASYPITEDAILYAQWTPNAWSIRFENEDGSLLYSAATPAGQMPVYQGEAPTKTGDAQYSYVFAGWTPELVPVTGEATYTARYEAMLNEYTVEFIDDDGTVLQTDLVPYGDTPVYEGDTPEKPADAQYTYTFAGWDPEIVPVTGDATYTATYTSTVNEYTITFVDEDGTVLQTGLVPYGDTPVFEGETPEKEATPEYTYTFAGWDPEIVPVTGDATYTAVYDSHIRSYTITYTVNGEEYTTQVYEVGAPVTAPEFEVPEFHTFTGWDVPETMPAEDITLDASLTIFTYTVTFIDGVTGEVIAEVTVEHGSDAEAPEAPEHAWYLFTGWDGDFTNVTEDLTITAVYRMLGDVDGDGAVTVTDATIVIRCAIGLIDGLDPVIADVNGDGTIDLIDALLILRHAMGLI